MKSAVASVAISLLLSINWVRVSFIHPRSGTALNPLLPRLRVVRLVPQKAVLEMVVMSLLPRSRSVKLGCVKLVVMAAISLLERSSDSKVNCKPCDQAKSHLMI